MGTYLLLGLSIPIWLWQGWRWLFGGERPASTGIWLLWLLYGAFALQGVFAVLSDRSGQLGGNLQLRSFPSFAMLAAPLVAVAFSRWRLPGAGRAAAGAVLALMAVAAFFKATNEPGLSNKWTFYTSAELRALEWADHHHRGSSVDERLSSAYLMAVGNSLHGNTWELVQPRPATRSLLISDVTYLQSVRLERPLPSVAGANRTYDNGAAQLYRLRPRTPYQR